MMEIAAHRTKCRCKLNVLGWGGTIADDSIPSQLAGEEVIRDGENQETKRRKAVQSEGRVPVIMVHGAIRAFLPDGWMDSTPEILLSPSKLRV